MDLSQVKLRYREVLDKLEREQIACFQGMNRPLLFICNAYPGVWLEHVQDAVLFAELEPSFTPVAINTLDLFMDEQSEEGQYPCYVLDPARKGKYAETVGRFQTQECVSFLSLALRVIRRTGNRELLKKAYASGAKWIAWQKKYRQTTGRGLVEAFVGYDTGHDNSGRLDGLSCRGNYIKDGVHQNAGVLPEGDDVAPMPAVDLNCIFYGNLRALGAMARLLGKDDEGDRWDAEAAQVKRNLFRYCYNPDDAFFYDVDKHGNQRKYLSCTVLHLFQEGVLDPAEDAEVIGQIVRRHLKNPEEFWTAYPFPSMAISDPTWKEHIKEHNCWGYWSMALTALRCSLWMDRYGLSGEYDHLCRRWVEAYTANYDLSKFGQGIDPLTGEPSPETKAQWYSAGMVFYTYAVRRLGLL